MLGLLIMGQPFGVVMTGIGVIANAGVIVNNNIVLIDTYDRLRREGIAAYEAILETCRERARQGSRMAASAIGGGRTRSPGPPAEGPPTSPLKNVKARIR